MPADLFDMELRALRRDRAFRIGAELFLHDRAFGDCLDRIRLLDRCFAAALLIGCNDAAWLERLSIVADRVDVVDPGPLFASAAGGGIASEDALELEVGRYDLCLAVGTLDTVNDLPRALLNLRSALKPDGFFLGAMSGGETLSQLRPAMRAADLVTGTAVPHVHPRIEASSLAGLLGAAGFTDAVVDVDRVAVAYRALPNLVRDLRAMGSTNILCQRSRRPLTREAWLAACEAFAAAGSDGRTVEAFEILHFAGWVPR